MTWRAVLPEPLRTTAAEVAREVAGRFRDIETVKRAVEATAAQQGKDLTQVWAKTSVANGSAGLAITFSYLDDCCPGEGWDLAGKQHLELAAKGLEATPDLSIGLFGGLSGIGFAAHCLSKNGTRYQRLLSTIDDLLGARLEEFCYDVKQVADAISPLHFDVVSGLSGVIGYLLARRGSGETQDSLLSALETLLWVVQESDGLPRWRTLPAQFLNPSYQQHFPNGFLDCGLAHGIPGAVTALAISSHEGIHLSQTNTAVSSLSQWIRSHSHTDGYGVNWRAMIALLKAPSGHLKESLPPSDGTQLGPSRMAWCYGNPGVARTLWLAGKAASDQSACDLAVQAMNAAISRPVEHRLIDSPTFCHGVSGLLQIVLRFANDTGLPEFSKAAEALTRQLLEQFEPGSILGFRDIDNERRLIDNPTLLEGAAAIPLVLMAAATDTEPLWDRLFMIS